MMARKTEADEKRVKYERLCVSKPWLDGFIMRNRLRSTAAHGEAGSVDTTAVGPKMAQICASFVREGRP